MALSFIVTGTAWKWFLDPGIGLENTSCITWGWESFSFRWIKDRNYGDLHRRHRRRLAVDSGFVMAMFLAGLRGVDNEVIKAAQIDGASTPTIYRRIIIPADAAGLPVSLRRPRPSRHQGLRPRSSPLTGGGRGTAT
jgi:glucose/mannose transport system permease protein